MSHHLRLRRRPPQVPPTVVDATAAAGILVVTAWLGSDSQLPGFRDFDGTALALTVLTNAPLTLRRRAPMAVLLICCAAATWFLGIGYPPNLNLIGPLLAAYTVAAMCPTRTALAGAAATAGVILYSGLVVEAYTPWAAFAQAVVGTLVACLFGAGARRLADRNRQLLVLAEELRQEREARARSAVVAERIRIARELHDVVAHHMSVISVHAGLARYVLPTDPATVDTALETISGSSHEALEEMRRMLALLRVADTDPRGRTGGHDPAPGLGRLDELVERVRATGTQVEVAVSGSPSPLPPGADLCAYRVVQESLTNVLKHARGARAGVTLDYGQPGRLTVRIADDGRGTPTGPLAAAGREADDRPRTAAGRQALTGPRAAAGREADDRPGSAAGPGGGHGLAGMRERARLYGGSVHAGAAPEGGFAVTLTLPVGVVPADSHQTVLVDGPSPAPESTTPRDTVPAASRRAGGHGQRLAAVRSLTHHPVTRCRPEQGGKADADHPVGDGEDPDRLDAAGREPPALPVDAEDQQT